MGIEWLGFKLLEKLVILKNSRIPEEDLEYKTCQTLVACINEIENYLQIEYDCDSEDIDMRDYV